MGWLVLLLLSLPHKTDYAIEKTNNMPWFLFSGDMEDGLLAICLKRKSTVLADTAGFHQNNECNLVSSFKETCIHTLQRRAQELMRRVKSPDGLTGYICSEEGDKFLVCSPLRIKEAERRYSTQFGTVLNEKRKRGEEEKWLFWLTMLTLKEKGTQEFCCWVTLRSHPSCKLAGSNRAKKVKGEVNRLMYWFPHSSWRKGNQLLLLQKGREKLGESNTSTDLFYTLIFKDLWIYSELRSQRNRKTIPTDLSMFWETLKVKK